MFLIDSHCHLDILNYKSIHKDLDSVLSKAALRDVKFFLTVSTTLGNYKKVRKLVGKRKNIVFSCGIHPLQNEVFKYNLEELYLSASEHNVVAIGETGLDYHQNSNIKSYQQDSFRNHISIARKLNKPIIVHSRSAIKDTLMILKEEKVMDCGGVLHCFTGDKIFASKLLDLGFYISFSGIITFNNSKRLHDIIRYIPVDRLLIETDSPYLTPVPYRGKENQPSMIRNIAEYLAMLKNMELIELAKTTTDNFIKLFKINNAELNCQ